MNNEVQEAILGSLVGGVLTFVATYFVELKKDREKRSNGVCKGTEKYDSKLTPLDSQNLGRTAIK